MWEQGNKFVFSKLLMFFLWAIYTALVHKLLMAYNSKQHNGITTTFCLCPEYPWCTQFWPIIHLVSILVIRVAIAACQLWAHITFPAIANTLKVQEKWCWQFRYTSFKRKGEHGSEENAKGKKKYLLRLVRSTVSYFLNRETVFTCLIMICYYNYSVIINLLLCLI